MEAFVWFGGTFSPPVKEHVQIIKAIAKKVCQLHPNPRGKITIGIVPVNADYPSSKVQPECILPQERLELCRGLLQAARAEIKEERVQITLIDTDIRAPTFYSVYKSISALAAPKTAKTTYIALRERNMKEILQRLWENSDDILSKYSFLPFADSTTVTASILGSKEKMAELLQRDYSRREYRPSHTIQRDSVGDILKKIHPLEGTFTDSKCSQKVREALIALNDLCHPLIYKKFMEIAAKRSNIYQAFSCGKDTESTNRNNSHRHNKTRRNKRRQQ